jgi:methylenetetrahydrofolate reductase (NADPH)
MSNHLPVSFEFFPAKTTEGQSKLALARQNLYALAPEFFSVTYGAGGSTQEGTLATVKAILQDGHQAAPHFSAIGADRAKVREQLELFTAAGVKRIVALRGDLPSGYGGFGTFRYAAELVQCIREETGKRFHIEVGCYPEAHPQASSPQADLLAFAAKVKAGADSAITQYFYNADAYFQFVEQARRLGVDRPVVPGVMPITNSTQLMHFSDICGAEIPRWIRLRLQSYGSDLESIRAFGLDVVTGLCDRLRAGGAPGFHFYTMNQSAPSVEICRRLGLRPPA